MVGNKLGGSQEVQGQAEQWVTWDKFYTNNLLEISGLPQLMLPYLEF